MASEYIEATILRPLVQSGKLPEEKYLPVLEAFRDHDWWNRWAIRALFALAVGHILAGIIFFFAHNWFGLSDNLKFGLVGGGIAVSVLLWISLGLDRVVGKSFGIAATVLVGVMFAVFGQVYQTPALLHTPFVLWAIMTLPFAAVSRHLAHWAVWLVIALVAIFAYAETGFYISGHPLAADMLILAAALGSAASLVALDQIIRPQFRWARKSWFRVFLIAICGALFVYAFTSSFWPWRNTELKTLSYLLNFVACLGALGFGLYLYKIRPTMAGLSLATFALTAIFVQIVLKMFQGSGWHEGVILLVFLIFTATTVGLGLLFTHYRRLTRRVSEATTEESETARRISLDEASEILGIPEGDLSGFQADIEAQENPWYIETFLAFAGMITATFGLTFFGLILSSVLDFDNFGVALLIVGVPLYVGALVARSKLKQGYLRHLFNTLLMVGAAMIIGGIGVALEQRSTLEWEIPVLGVLVLAGLNIALVRDPIIEFLSTLIAMAALYFYLGYDLRLPYFEIILVAFSTGLAMISFTRFVGKRLLTPAASALLINAMLASLSFGLDTFIGTEADASYGLRSVYTLAGVLIAGSGIIYLNLIHKTVKSWRPPLFILLPLLAAMILFPFGGASALLLILVGYILGHRTLALLGVLLQIYYLYMFYYELSISLATKAYILMAVGYIFLAIWYFARPSETMEARA